MRREEIEKLLGGYATDTLTAEERQLLFEAALEDQGLFDRLAHEQALRDLLQDPAARRELAASLDAAPGAWWDRLGALLWKPALAGAACIAAAMAIAVGVWKSEIRAPSQVAQVRAPVAPAESVPVVPVPQAEAVRKSAPEKKQTPRRPTREVAPRPAAPALAADSMRNLGGAAPAQPGVAGGVAGGAVGGVIGGYPAAQGKMEVLSAPASAGLREAGTAAAPRPLGLHYEVLRRNLEGQFSAVPPGAVLRAGDTVRLRFDLRQEGFLYVLLRDANAWKPVFTGRVRVGRQYDADLPPITAPGARELIAIVSPEESAALAAGNPPAVSAASNSPVTGRLSAARASYAPPQERPRTVLSIHLQFE